ncbi:hyalin-like [Patiria miniata]|uniref:HYR domain-containing protein n=1 Tax=Patiria miniata TaxID=46514 RepID=A0A914BA59_PATMI|nr:hyalin-like [Patiria miniata]
MYIPEDGPYPLGTNTVTYTATDSSRNSASCTVEVTVKDEERPTILTCIDSVGTTNMGSGVATASYELPTGIDNSGLEVTVQCTPVLGTLLPLGTHTVTCVFRDQAVPVNINLCFITVTVGDDEMPSIACPSNITVGTDAGESHTIQTFPTSYTASDNSGSFAVNITNVYPGLPSQGPFTPGSTYTFEINDSPYIWYYIAYDSHGNEDSCVWTISVIDDENPDITCPAAIMVFD